MGEWNPCEYWESVTCVMMIRTGCQNTANMAAAQCATENVNIRREPSSCDGDYEAATKRKGHCWDSDCDERRACLFPHLLTGSSQTAM